MLGGGQLGRMFTHAAQRLGYHVHIFEPAGPGCPAGQAADRETNANYDDTAELTAFARTVAAVTYEFENVPAAPLAAIERLTTLRPRPEVLHICQNRSREKNWLRAQGIPHARFAEVAPGGDLAAAIREVGLPCIVKTADFGYDGKGQMKVRDAADVPRAAAAFARARCVIEQFIDFACEVSVIVARRADGAAQEFPVAENIHTNHILDVSIVPARVPPAVERAARELGRAIVGKLDVVGLLAIEMFVTKGGVVLVNELAPRPHNSGHYTMEGCATSQFEQHVRAVCGLPLGDVSLRAPSVMVNILGDSWPAGGEPDWTAVLGESDAHLHLYGKTEPRAGRKMGHFTVLRPTVDEALATARAVKARLDTPAGQRR